MYCPPISITFLGTGTSSGVPMIGCSCEVCTSANPKDNRLRSSIMVSSANTQVVIDTTPDFRYQMLRLGVNQLDGIVYTHSHKDHIAGLDDVRPFNYFTKKSMAVYATAATQEALKREFHYAFAAEKYPGIPQLDMHLIDPEKPFSIGDIPFQPILVKHLHMPVLGFRMGHFTYITDANYISAVEKEKIVGSSHLVLNALRKEPHISHFTLAEACDLADELQIPQAYFTHISHQLGRHDAVEASLPANRSLAYDGLQIQLPVFP